MERAGRAAGRRAPRSARTCRGWPGVLGRGGGDATGTLATSWHLRLAAKRHGGSPGSVPTRSRQPSGAGRGVGARRGLGAAARQGPREVAAVPVPILAMPGWAGAAHGMGRAGGGCRAVGPHTWWLCQCPRPPPAPPRLRTGASLSLQTQRHGPAEKTHPALGTLLRVHTPVHAHTQALAHSCTTSPVHGDPRGHARVPRCRRPRPSCAMVPRCRP